MLSTVIGAFCIILYIGALLYGVLNMYSSITERRVLADREFDDLADLAVAAGVLGFMDEKFIQTIQDAINGSETILGVVISGSKGEFAFERERGTVISWVNNSPRFVSRFGITKPTSLPLRIEGQRNVNIQTVSSYLDYEFCIEILKRTLLVALIALALSFFTLLMGALFKRNAGYAGGLRARWGRGLSGGAGQDGRKKKAGRKKDGKPAAEESPDDIVDAALDGEPDDTQGDILDDMDDEAEMEEEDPAERLMEDKGNVDFSDIDEEEFPDFDNMESPLPGDPRTETQAAYPRKDKDEDKSIGLYSPRSNVGWESYTKDRLESELRRNTAAGEDLVLIAVMFKEPEKLNPEQFREFAEEAVRCFEHRDLIFELGEQGLRIVCPNYSLDQGFAAAGEFNGRVLSSMAESADLKADLRFGISSRSGRLVPAEQIMLESDEALKRALEDPASHIVAFKSDPEKYRRYISGQNPRSA